MQGRRSAIHLEVDDQTRATLAQWLRSQNYWAWPNEPRLFYCSLMATPSPPRPVMWAYANVMCANGRCVLRCRALMDSLIHNVQVADPFFPPAVALYVVKIACERPDVVGRSLSQWDSTELARQLVQDGVVDTISPQTVQRILASHKLKPWRHHLWLSPQWRAIRLLQPQNRGDCERFYSTTRWARGKWCWLCQTRKPVCNHGPAKRRPWPRNRVDRYELSMSMSAKVR